MFKNGKKHGRGVQTVTTGYKYHGDWEDGLVHGSGAFFLPDGERIVRLWDKMTFREACYDVIEGKRRVVKEEVSYILLYSGRFTGYIYTPR